MVVECDSELVVKAVLHNLVYYLEIGHVFESCREILISNVDFSLCHVKKQANKGAHLMARLPVALNCFSVFTSPPISLLETLDSDIRS